MHLSGIFVYPIKAMGGIALKSVNLEERGIRLDRRWMLIDENNRFISQRRFSQLALFQLEIQESSIKVNFKDEHILVPFDENQYPERAKVSVWNDEIEALVADEHLNNWFSDQLGTACKLAYQGLNSIRLTSNKYAPSQEVSFADGYPYLMISEESLNLLNEKLKHPVEMNRFRPNLIVKGGHPHIEDEYHYYKIGKVLFKGVKPCIRCKVITIDQTTLSESPEPLKTLATYRNSNNGVFFGQNLLLQESDQYIINAGDPIDVLDKKIQDNQSSNN